MNSPNVRNFYKLVVLLLLFIFAGQFFYAFSMKNLTKMNDPSNSLFYIEVGGIGNLNSSLLEGAEDFGERNNSYPDMVEVAVNFETNANVSNDSCVAKRRLRGLFKVNLTAPAFYKISQDLPDLQLGGYFIPNCTHTERIALIVPFRDRKEHLGVFLNNVHPMLQRQQIEYQIFVIEQEGTDPFNRAMLFNVGFKEAMAIRNFSCFIFHDVDLIPENDYNLYQCPTPSSPRHMSVAVDTMRYRLPYRTIFGGISALTREQFLLVNGFSNRYWGWGAEDDDMANRIAYRGLFISRYPPTVARYKMLKHKHQKPNTNRYRILHKGKKQFTMDGLASLNYTVEEVALNRLYVLVKVRLFKL